MLRLHLSLEKLVVLVLVITLTTASLPLTALAELIKEGDDYVVYEPPEIQEEVEEISEESDSTLELNPDTEGYNARIDGEKNKEVSILDEITSLRDRNLKHVKLSDGTQMINIYPLDIHYLRNGIWEEIDNTLVKSTETNRVKASSSNLDISLSRNAVTDKLVSLNEVSLTLKTEIRSVLDVNYPLQLNNVPLTIIQPNELASKTVPITDESIKDYEKLRVENLYSKGIYSDIISGVDLEYTIMPNGIKEDIIVKEKRLEYSFDFLLTTGNLKALQQDKHTVHLMDLDDEIKYIIRADYIEDSVGAYDAGVSLTLKEESNGYTLTVEADSGWLNDSKRVWPIKIDPTIVIPVTSGIRDASCFQREPDNNWLNFRSSVYVGRDSSNYDSERTYISFDLPVLPEGSRVIKSNLNLYQNTYSSWVSGAAVQVNAHQTTGSWNPTNLTWNNKPLYNSAVIDCVKCYSASPSNPIKYSLDLTPLVRSWYDTIITNYGVTLRYKYESQTDSSYFRYALFYSTRAGGAGVSSSYFPSVEIRYVNHNGLEGYWTTQNMSAGIKSGTVYVKEFAGDLIYIHDDMNTTGLRMPISIQHVYNLSQALSTNPVDVAENSVFGNGFRLNYSQRIIEYNQAGCKYYYIDADGTKHYFKPTDQTNVFVAEYNSNLVLTKTIVGFTLETHGENKLYFGTNGYLTKISDTNGNNQTLTYSSNRLIRITDGSGSYLSLAYTNGRLSSIADMDGRQVIYNYGLNDNLSSIGYENGRHTYLEYNSKLLTLITADDYTKILIEYSDLSQDYKILRVDYLSLLGKNYAELSKILFKYKGEGTRVTDTKMGIYYDCIFDNMGRTISVLSSEDYASFSSYRDTEDNMKNALEYASDTQYPIRNILNNHSAEITSNWVAYYTTGNTGSCSYTTEQSYKGLRSLKVNTTNEIYRRYYHYSVIFKSTRHSIVNEL